MKLLNWFKEILCWHKWITIAQRGTKDGGIFCWFYCPKCKKHYDITFIPKQDKK